MTLVKIASSSFVVQEEVLKCCMSAIKAITMIRQQEPVKICFSNINAFVTELQIMTLLQHSLLST